jgi:hypothetical protein
MTAAGENGWNAKKEAVLARDSMAVQFVSFWKLSEVLLLYSGHPAVWLTRL